MKEERSFQSVHFVQCIRSVPGTLEMVEVEVGEVGDV